MDKRNAVSASLLTIAAIPWLLATDWRPILVGVVAVTMSAAIVVHPRLARILLLGLCGVSLIMFFVAGLYREGIEIGERPYMGMQLLTPISVIAFFLCRHRAHESGSG